MDDDLQTHDPEKTLADFRDHLSRHDKPIAFLFGAGTSCAVRVPDSGGDSDKTRPLIPAVAELTKICRERGDALGKVYAKAWKLIEARCNELGQEPNIENILSRLRMMGRAVSGTDRLCGLNGTQIEKLEACVRKSIAHAVTPDLGVLVHDSPHRRFARWVSRASRQAAVEIFTVNYDVLIEEALEAERVPVFDGFVGSYRPFFHADTVRRKEAAPASGWTRLWKMHGSVTWGRIVEEGAVRIVRQLADTEGEMIYPSFEKYDESRQLPYSALIDRLRRFLEQDDALLVVSGFNFGDEHVNNVIFGALDGTPRTHVYALQYEELSDEHQVAKRAYQRSNLIVCGPETGLIGGVRGRWRRTPSSSFAEMVVEDRCTACTGDVSAASEGEDGDYSVMKIGDFASFCGFLDSMTAR